MVGESLRDAAKGTLTLVRVARVSNVALDVATVRLADA